MSFREECSKWSLHELEREINLSATSYYVTGTSVYSDREFDMMIDELRLRDPESDILRLPGWGYKPDDNSKVKHPFHTIEGIANKYKDRSQVPQWDTVIAMPKFDGCSVICYYSKGVFQKALTRGDGTYGEDVTNNCRGKELVVRDGFTGYVRCESVISFENFKKFPPDRRLRNSATGLIGAINPDRELLQYVELKPVIMFNSLKNSFELPDSGLRYDSGYIQELSFPYMKQLCSDYLCDGIVVRNGDDLTQIYAFKFDTEIVETLVTRVEWVTQDTGKIFPTIWFNPIEISGCTAEKVSGKSFEFIKSNQIDAGTKVEIVRSGEVIPNIYRVLPEQRSPAVPSSYPKCSHGCDIKLIRVKGANAYCTNPECPSIEQGILKRLIYQWAPKGFSIDMYELIQKWCNSNIQNLLYKIRSDRLLIAGTGHQVKLITQVLRRINKFKITLHELVNICAIEGFGDTLSSKMELNFGDPKFFHWYCSLLEDLVVKDCPNSRARESWKRRHNWINLILSYFELQFSENYFRAKAMKKEEDEERLNTKQEVKCIVCITGKLEGMTKSQFAEKYLIPAGYEYTKDIKLATILINADGRESSKVKFARSKAIKIVSPLEFTE